MKIFPLIYLILFLTSCTHTQPRATTSETMMVDGKTWQITVSAFCSDLEGDDEACEKRLYTVMADHGKELCGAPPERTFSCGVRILNLRPFMTCYSKCK